jgi:hypothetical protein
MLPNWLYGKSKSKLADILGGGGGGGTTYTAGPGISINNDNRISFRGDTAPYDNSDSGLEANTVKGAIDELTEDVATDTSATFTAGTNMKSGEKRLIKWGKLVTFGWSTQANSTGVPSNEIIATLPSGFCPVNSIEIVAMDANDGKAIQLTIFSDGRVRATNNEIPANHWLIFTISFLTI